MLLEALILLVNILNTAIRAYAPLLASFPDPARLLLGACSTASDERAGPGNEATSLP